MKSQEIKLRTANAGDIPAMSALYSETVQHVNNADYSPEQIKVWSGSAYDSARWEDRISTQYFILAEIDSKLAGFGSVDPNGYLDFMYVSKVHQRMGAAKAILDEIERKAEEQNNPQIYSHVSKTAFGFFEKYGYQKVRELNDPYKGVVFTNNLMVKDYRGKDFSPNIKTERLLLRRYIESDRANSMRLSLDKEVMHFMGGEHAENEEQASSIFDKCFEIYKGWLGEKPLGTRRFELWGIENEGRLIGHFELKQSVNTTGNELEIVYLLDKAYWGKGLIPEAIKAVKKYAKSTGNVVIATINPENNRTVRSLEKSGIAKQGWIEDSEGKIYKVWLK